MGYEDFRALDEEHVNYALRLQRSPAYDLVDKAILLYLRDAAVYAAATLVQLIAPMKASTYAAALAPKSM